MAIADKLLELNQAKQDIKSAIETKGVSTGGVPFTNYASKILEISGGGGMTYEDYARTLYLIRGKINQFTTVWEHSLTVNQSEISATSTTSNQRGIAQYPNGETEGVIIPEGVTSIGNYAFYYWETNNQPLVIPSSVTSIGSNAFRRWNSNNQPLVIPEGVTSIGNQAFIDWTSNEQPLTISSSVTSIGNNAFQNWYNNNQALIIPEGVTSIGDYAFANWNSNNQPLVIPNSVTSIGNSAFRNWPNEQPLVITGGVTSISNYAFYGWSSVPYVFIQAFTPPTLGHNNAFGLQNDAPIYVPDFTLNAYKTATNWKAIAFRIFPYSDM